MDTSGAPSCDRMMSFEGVRPRGETRRQTQREDFGDRRGQETHCMLHEHPVGCESPAELRTPLTPLYDFTSCTSATSPPWSSAKETLRLALAPVPASPAGPPDRGAGLAALSIGAAAQPGHPPPPPRESPPG